jgi:hypothetical protein
MERETDVLPHYAAVTSNSKKACTERLRHSILGSILDAM